MTGVILRFCTISSAEQTAELLYFLYVRATGLYGTTYFANSATRGTIFKIDQNGSN